MDDAVFCEQHPRAHMDVTEETCGGMHDEPCAESAAWRLDRAWGARSLRGYCTRHAAVKIRADDTVLLMKKQAEQSRKDRRQ